MMKEQHEIKTFIKHIPFVGKIASKVYGMNYNFLALKNADILKTRGISIK